MNISKIEPDVLDDIKKIYKDKTFSLSQDHLCVWNDNSKGLKLSYDEVCKRFDGRAFIEMLYYGSAIIVENDYDPSRYYLQCRQFLNLSIKELCDLKLNTLTEQDILDIENPNKRNPVKNLSKLTDLYFYLLNIQNVRNKHSIKNNIPYVLPKQLLRYRTIINISETNQIESDIEIPYEFGLLYDIKTLDDIINKLKELNSYASLLDLIKANNEIKNELLKHNVDIDQWAITAFKIGK